jgi:hypothetical protein
MTYITHVNLFFYLNPFTLEPEISFTPGLAADPPDILFSDNL